MCFGLVDVPLLRESPLQAFLTIRKMSITKTRLKLLEVARSLFAHQGFEATTMNDIAAASGRGRRTLYTYFRNKEEIYNAVIEEELDSLSDKVDEVVATADEPEDKVFKLVYTHLSIIREMVARNGTLRAEFFRNIWVVEKVRKAFDEEERDLLAKVLQEGVDRGRFKIDHVGLMADIIHYSLKGLEVPYIYDRLGEGLAEDETYPIVRRILNRVLNLQPGAGHDRATAMSSLHPALK